ncbi:MAG TPA: response regulator [Abditibacteriaceae bacterium]
MQSSLIRILPACLTDPLPAGWEQAPAGYLIEVMPEVEAAEAVVLSLQATEADLLLLDGDLPGLDAFSLTEAVLTALPQVAVVIISSDSSPDRLRRAMLAGVEEYLIKPLDAAAMRESIVAVASHRTLRVVQDRVDMPAASEAAGVVVGIVSGKGGLGKTTLATNLAAIVAKTPGRSAALIGMESGDASVLLSLQPKVGMLDMAGATHDDSAYTADWLAHFTTAHRTGIHYFTWQGVSTQVPEVIPDDFLPNLFEMFRRTYSATIVDFPLLSPDEAVAYLPLVDIIVVVSSSSDLLALKATKSFLEVVPPEIEQRVRVVINRADATDMISRDDFEKTLDAKILASLPNQPKIASEAINMGSPFALTQKDSELAINLRAIATRLFKLPAEVEDKPRRRFMLFS